MNTSVRSRPRPEIVATLRCAPSLRAAAATLSQTRSDLVTATTFVGLLGREEAPAVEALVADIAAEFGLDSQVRVRSGSFRQELVTCSIWFIWPLS